MVISRSSWERLVELWDISEVVSIISKALASLHMIEIGLYERGVDVDTLIRNIRSCESILRKLLVDLELYISGKAPESELVTLLMEAYGETDVEKLKHHLKKAIQGLEKLTEMATYRPLDKDMLRDEDIAELENLLTLLSSTLSKKAEQMASELYAI